MKSSNKTWGFKETDGRLHIDVKRYKKACEDAGNKNYLPEDLLVQKGPYYVPSKIKRYDYKVNIFRDFLWNLKEDWLNEFKPLLSELQTSKSVEDAYRLDAIAATSCSDDYEDIYVEALMAGIKRQPKYIKVVNALYCQFIQKIAVEVERCILIVLVQCGFDKKCFTFGTFESFSKNLAKEKRKPKMKSFQGCDSLYLLHELHIFLKHNTKDAYERLKKHYPSNVASIENGTARIEYENGMFAGDWIIVKENYIDDLLDDLNKFFEEYCETYFEEDKERSAWDYDEYFYNAAKQMRDSQ